MPKAAMPSPSPQGVSRHGRVAGLWTAQCNIPRRLQGLRHGKITLHQPSLRQMMHSMQKRPKAALGTVRVAQACQVA